MMLAKATWPCGAREDCVRELWQESGEMEEVWKRPNMVIQHIRFLTFFLHIYLSIMCIYISDQSIVFFFFFFSGPHHTTCRILGPQPGIKPKPSAVETCSCNHWTAKDVLKILSSKGRMFKVTKILRGGVSSILQTQVNIKYFYTPVIPPNAK